MECAPVCSGKRADSAGTRADQSDHHHFAYTDRHSHAAMQKWVERLKEYGNPKSQCLKMGCDCSELPRWTALRKGCYTERCPCRSEAEVINGIRGSFGLSVSVQIAGHSLANPSRP